MRVKHALPTSAMIYGSKVALTIFGKKSYSIVRIENKDFANSYRKFFRHYWERSRSD